MPGFYHELLVWLDERIEGSKKHQKKLEQKKAAVKDKDPHLARTYDTFAQCAGTRARTYEDVKEKLKPTCGE